MVLENNLKDLAIFRGFSLHVRKYLEFQNHTKNFKEANPRHIPVKNYLPRYYSF
jgi:hypothetical protein